MHDYYVVQILCIRNAFLVVAILLTAGLHDWATLFRISDPIMQTSRAVLPFLASMFLFLALKYVPLAEATAIMFASPLFLTILSIYMLGERVGAKHWSAILLGFLGVGIILRPGSEAGHWAALLLLLAAAFIALYQIITKTLSLSASLSATLLFTGAVGTVLTILFLPFFWTTPDLIGALLIIALGIAYGASHYFWFKALAIAPASTLAPFVYTQIIAATAFGFIIFHEVPDLQTVIGSAIIIASGLIVFLRSRPEDDDAAA
jgi:drug/metabolite transporter (DMT)-like permease